MDLKLNNVAVMFLKN